MWSHIIIKDKGKLFQYGDVSENWRLWRSVFLNAEYYHIWKNMVVQKLSIIQDADDVGLSVPGNSCLYVYSLR